MQGPRVHRCLLRCLAWWLAAGLCGCAGLPPVRPAASTALQPTFSTELGRVALSSTPGPQLTGFRLLPNGAFALDARAALVQRAQRSLDLQYYVLSDDATGRWLLRSLSEAASRGVRVRLLLDDLYTAGEDELLLGLQARPNVQVRLFNPFPAGRSGLVSRLATSLLDLRRVNHRMHNKLLIADGALAIAGGRNMADEYFARGSAENFIDLDALMIGGAVWELADIFDQYWNSPFAYPLPSVARSDLGTDELRSRFDRHVGTALAPAAPAPLDVLGHRPIGRDIDEGWLGLTWSVAQAVADPPDKITGALTQYAGIPLLDVQSVRHQVLERFAQARSEVVMNTPYFVPGHDGMALLLGLAARGVKVDVLTNSLASTDEPLVALGYRRYRKPLLEAGVTLHELSPDRIRQAEVFRAIRDSVGRLHAKTVVIDRRIIFLGSMNFDPRSEGVNTEMGLLIDSTQLAEEMLRLMGIDRQRGAVRVTLSPQGELQWQVDEDGHPRFLPEPGSDRPSLWLWHLLAPLAPEQLL